MSRSSSLPPAAHRRCFRIVKGSFRIAHIAGSEVRIHVTFLMLLGLVALSAWQSGGWSGAMGVTALFLLLFLSVLLHEFGHALAARSFGIRTPDITILPIGGLARLERAPASPWQEFVITVAGPAVNVVIALALAPFVGREFALSQLLSNAELFNLRLTDDLLANVFLLNVVLVKFNLIPAFPMDGGRIFRAILATQMSHLAATRVAAWVGQGIAVLFVLYSFSTWEEGNFMLLVIAVFIFLGAGQELAWANFRHSVKGRPASQLMVTRFETLLDTMRVNDARDILVASSQEIFPVVDEDMTFRGLLNRQELLAAMGKISPEAAVTTLLRPIPTITPDTDSFEVLETMQRSRETVLPVVNFSGQIVGLVELSQMVPSRTD